MGAQTTTATPAACTYWSDLTPEERAVLDAKNAAADTAADAREAAQEQQQREEEAAKLRVEAQQRLVQQQLRERAERASCPKRRFVAAAPTPLKARPNPSKGRWNPFK